VDRRRRGRSALSEDGGKAARRPPSAPRFAPFVGTPIAQAAQGTPLVTRGLTARKRAA
jgi:hypothetical protein